MSILNEILDAATSSEVPISDLLRRVCVLAARLGNSEMSDWVDRELNGYPNHDALPAYRQTEAHAYGNFAGPFYSGLNNVPIPPATLPDSLRIWATKAYLLEPIRLFEELLKEPAGGSFTSPWPPDLIMLMQRRQIYEGMSLLTAWTDVPRGAIVGVIENVRNRVQAFALDLEKVSPEISGGATIKPATQERAHESFQLHIYGPVGNVAVGSTGFQQRAVFEVEAGNLDSLVKALLELPVPGEDVAQLKEAVAADGAGTGKAIGPSVADWLARMISKAATGAWNVGLATASNILPKLLERFYNLP